MIRLSEREKEGREREKIQERERKKRGGCTRAAPVYIVAVGTPFLPKREKINGGAEERAESL